MARYYASRIERGFLTLDGVPTRWREATLQILIEDGYYDEDGNPIEWMLNFQTSPAEIYGVTTVLL